MKNPGNAHVVMAVHSDYLHDHRVIREAETLAGAGYNVSVIAASESHTQKKPFHSGDVTVIPVKLRQRGGKLKFAAMMKQVHRELGNLDADVIQAHDLDTLIPCALAAKKKNAKLIYDSHELYTDTRSVYKRKLTRSVWSAVERRYIHRADAVITVSNGIADILQERYQLKERPIVLRNFTDHPKYLSAENTAATFFSGDVRYKGLYSGILQSGRGIEMMIETVAELDDWRLIICGDGPVRSILEEQAKQSGAQDRIHFTGMISRESLSGIMQNADAGFLLTQPDGLSHIHSLPNKLTEYIHHGLPVICSDLPEIASLIKTHRAGEVVTDKTSLKNILQAFEGRGKYKADLEKASQKLNWDKEKERLLGLYGRVLGD